MDLHDIVEAAKITGAIVLVLTAAFLIDPYYRRYKVWVDNKFKGDK